ncbi:RusA family crossover junction endodeoxyribonuclease [Roseibium sp. RKSG952]|uniref:RusA family crossover junction endodeoxyribonuclease n=1 Tax=Roseibium sp. RKSG952 TaxID=2529384 RepID=UPI0012BBEF2B|nr:RusA family crossover junction endodeoxyribonuclease [Roseibium sp. RKSG952]
MSTADARRLGINLSGNKSKPSASAKTSRTKCSRLPANDTQTDPCEFHIDLPHDPKPKERPRTVLDLGAVSSAFVQAKGNLNAFLELVGKGRSRTYTPKSTAEYEKLISVAAASAMKSRRPMECAISVEMTFILKGDPETWPISNKSGDIDNLSKAVLDALNGIVFIDDRLVVETICRKTHGERSRLKVRASEARPTQPGFETS